MPRDITKLLCPLKKDPEDRLCDAQACAMFYDYDGTHPDKIPGECIITYTGIGISELVQTTKDLVKETKGQVKLVVATPKGLGGPHLFGKN